MDTLSTSLAFIDGLGAPEMLLIFVLVLVLFGGQKLPEFARGLGKTIREFKKAAAGVEEEFKRALDEDERKQNVAKYEPPPALPPGSTDATATADPAGPHGASDPYHDEYGHEYYENQDGTTDTAPAPTEADPAKAAAAGSPDTPAAAATTPAPDTPSDATSDPVGPTESDLPPKPAAPPPPAAGGPAPNPPPAGPAAAP